MLHHRKTEVYQRDLLALAPFSGATDTTTAQMAINSAENLPLFDTISSERWKPLPDSSEEVESISGLYQRVICKIDKAATEAYLKAHSTGNRYLHLATHGYLDAEQPMYAGLLFSEDILQTYEIFNMDIDADLVVLSACETGLGALTASEGLVGLTRAFIYSGTPSVVVSLWSVADQSTVAFMKRFYKNLNKGMTKVEALTEAKQWMIKYWSLTDAHGNVVIKGNHPFYWAPFIIIGSHQ